MPTDTAAPKKTPWKNKLAEPTSRPEYGIFCDIIGDKDRNFVPPPGSADPEENRQMLKSLAARAYEVDPQTLVLKTLGGQLRVLSEQLSGSSKRADFVAESVQWCALHLVNRYASRDLKRGDGQRSSDAISSNCLEWWDPAKGGFVPHVQNYFARTLRPDFLEEQLERRKNEGASFYSLDEAKAMGYEPSISEKGIAFGRERQVAASDEFDADNEAFEAVDREGTESEGNNYATEKEDELGERPSRRFRHDEIPPTFALLSKWLERNKPEMCEGLSRGDRQSRLAALRTSCREVLTKMASPEEELLIPDQRSDAKILLEDFDNWDPRRITWEAQFPEVVGYLNKEAEVAAVKEKLQREMADNSSGFLFPSWEIQDRTGENKTVVHALVDVGDRDDHASATSTKTDEVESRAAENREIAKFLGVEIEAGSDLGSIEISRALAIHWADAVLCPSPDDDGKKANLIDDYRNYVKSSAAKWPFDGKHGFGPLLSRSLTRLVEERDFEGTESELVMCTLADHMQKTTERRPWMDRNEIKTTLQSNDRQRTEY